MFAGLCSREKLWIRDNNGNFGRNNYTKHSLTMWARVREEVLTMYPGARGHTFSDCLCQGRCTQLVFNKCLLFAVLIAVATRHWVDSAYGDVPMRPSPDFSPLLEFVLGG